MSQPVFDGENTAVETTHGIPLRNLWYMLLYAWQELPHSPYWQAVADVDAPTLDSLLASMLSRMLQQRLRIGLGCRYMPEKKLLRGIRGRIDFTDSLKQQTLPKGQAFCEYEHYSINAPPNQIIRTTLFHLAQVGDFGVDQKKAELLRHQLRFLVRTLAGIDLIELTPELMRRQQTVRHDRDYRLMLSICELILRRRLPTEFEGERFVTELEREHFVLYQVYEQFVANFYQYHLSEWHVQSQKTYLPKNLG